MTTPPWPADFNLPPNHCADVLNGSYDIPFNPETPPQIIDIGANVGAFVIWATKRWPGCSILAYEPQPDNFARLAKTVAALPDPGKVAILQNAVADGEGTAKLFEGQFNCGEWSLYGAKVGKGAVEVEVIPAVTLPKADILKIDAEGAEAVILASLAKAGRMADFKAIVLECHSGLWVDPFKFRLKEAGFVLTGENVHSEHRREMKWVREGFIKP